MEEKSASANQKTVDQTTVSPEYEGYVAPEVVAAREGKQVEFGHDLTSS
jgi:hypothetical protein